MRALPLSLRSVSQLFPWASPPGPSCPASSPRHWHRLPGPPVAWPSPSLLGPSPNQQLQVPTFPSCLHKVTIVHGTREDHLSPCCYRERMFTQGRRPHLHAVRVQPPMCHTQAEHIPHEQAHTAGAENRRTRHGTSLQTQNGHKGVEQAQQGHSGGLPLAETRPSHVWSFLRCGFPLQALGHVRIPI